MKYTLALTAALGLASSVAAMPPAPVADRQVQYPIVNITFYGGPASYSMSFLADGATYQTNSDMSVDVIDGHDYNAINQCTFTTDHEKTLLQRFYLGGESGDEFLYGIRLLVGPPQPIRAVSCLGNCVDNGDFCYEDGRSVGECCNGYCDAPNDGKCHAWTTIV